MCFSTCFMLGQWLDTNDALHNCDWGQRSKHRVLVTLVYGRYKSVGKNCWTFCMCWWHWHSLVSLFFLNTLSQCPFVPNHEGLSRWKPNSSIDHSSAINFLSHVGWSISVQTIKWYDEALINLVVSLNWRDLCHFFLKNIADLWSCHNISMQIQMGKSTLTIQTKVRSLSNITVKLCSCSIDDWVI